MIEREQIRDREAKNRRRSEYVEVEKRKIEKDPSRDIEKCIIERDQSRG